MTDVLISYARRDRGIAARLAACLEERGLKAVWDVSELPEGAIVVAARFRGRPGEPAAIQAEMDRISAAREMSQPLRSTPTTASMSSSSIDCLP